MQISPKEQNRREKQRSASIEPRFDARLGWRIAEWTALTGTSRPTLWRQIKAGHIKAVHIGGITIIPRTEAVRLGLLSPEAA